MLIYVISSLKNSKVIDVANRLEAEGFDPFMDWFCPGPNADDHLRDYYKARGKTYIETMNAPIVANQWEFDRRWLNKADIALMLMPCGKSGHLELGYAIGKGKPGYILFEEPPERIDMMHKYATGLFMNIEDLVAHLRDHKDNISEPLEQIKKQVIDDRLGALQADNSAPTAGLLTVNPASPSKFSQEDLQYWWMYTGEEGR